MTVMRECSRLPWQQQLIEGFKDARQLLEYLSIDAEGCTSLAEQQFKTRVPKCFAKRMCPGDRRDPLLLQVLAQAEEMHPSSAYVSDPLHESSVNPVNGLIHKYHGRVLLTASGSCAVNCRYCFRRHFPYNDNQLSPKTWHSILNYIAQNETIEEVILSGGDPLMLNDTAFARVVERLASLPQIKTLRIHSRIPIVLPGRITQALCRLLADSPFHVVMVVHCNHPNEIDADVHAAMKALANSGVHRLNQSVLLKGVNDSLGTLKQLSQRLFDIAVWPYYLHLLDKVAGAAHFAIDREQALALHQQMQACLPGYLVPKLVEELPGDKAKSWVSY